MLTEINDAVVPAKVIDVSSLLLQGKEKYWLFPLLLTSLNNTKLLIYCVNWIMNYVVSLLLSTERNKILKKWRIIFCTGAYAPLTRKGNIIVNEVLASCYPSSVDYHLTHWSTTPIRWFPEIIQMIFGKEEGISTFIKISKELGIWMLPYRQLWWQYTLKHYNLGSSVEIRQCSNL